MIITLESTTKIIHLNGVPARIWEGQTDSGIKVHAYITRVAVDEKEPESNIKIFEQELQEQRKPSPEIEAIPLRMII